MFVKWFSNAPSEDVIRYARLEFARVVELERELKALSSSINASDHHQTVEKLQNKIALKRTRLEYLEVEFPGLMSKVS